MLVLLFYLWERRKSFRICRWDMKERFWAIFITWFSWGDNCRSLTSLSISLKREPLILVELPSLIKKGSSNISYGKGLSWYSCCRHFCNKACKSLFFKIVWHFSELCSMALCNGFSWFTTKVRQTSWPSDKSWNGFRPVQSCRMMQPNAQMSDLKLNWPFIYSGLMYLSVPAFISYSLWLSSVFWDTPKSMILTTF